MSLKHTVGVGATAPLFPHPTPSTHLFGHFPGEVGVGDEFEAALVAGLVVDDLHFPVIVQPQLAHNHVVHCRGHLAESVVVACNKLLVSKTGLCADDATLRYYIAKN